MKKQRKHYTPEEKVAIRRRHFVEGVPVSDLCDERGLLPTVLMKTGHSTHDEERVVRIPIVSRAIRKLLGQTTIRAITSGLPAIRESRVLRRYFFASGAAGTRRSEL